MYRSYVRSTFDDRHRSHLISAPQTCREIGHWLSSCRYDSSARWPKSPGTVSRSSSSVARLRWQPSATTSCTGLRSWCWSRSSVPGAPRTCSKNRNRPPGLRTRLTSRRLRAGSATVHRTSAHHRVEGSVGKGQRLGRAPHQSAEVKASRSRHRAQTTRLTGVETLEGEAYGGVEREVGAPAVTDLQHVRVIVDVLGEQPVVQLLVLSGLMSRRYRDGDGANGSREEEGPAQSREQLGHRSHRRLSSPARKGGEREQRQQPHQITCAAVELTGETSYTS